MSVRKWITPRRLRSAGRLLAVGVLAVALEVGLRIASLPTVARLARVRLELGGHDTPATGAAPLELSARERRDVDLALWILRRAPVDDTCLRRSLLVGHLLRHRQPVLRIGVTKQDGVVRAHAWLVVEGVAIDDGAAAGFSVLRAGPVRRVPA